MKTLIAYFRQCFCKHEYERIEELGARINEYGEDEMNIRVSLLCTRCGYHKSFWKFL